MDGSFNYEVLEAEELLANAIYLWTFDDVSDIKDQEGITWAQPSASLQSTPGVRGRAVKALGGSGLVRLADDKVKGYLSRPNKNAQITVALWLLYQSKASGVAQTFLAAGDQAANGDRGIHLYQEDGSRPELTFRTKGVQIGAQ
ncbi:hypothetical protein OS493_033040 [Desmophyllum pertusum]|uniref:Uncharacterized protein n=1 Tax=Desmophyllum pertusum TaxID=174260 RepID=A0A9X0D0X4_9CNID|nr:hypothetical protein OS493_033040 [Desmophyllum pertusum]